MSGSLRHPPARIIQQLLVDLGLGVDNPDGTWPIFVNHMPDSPDNAIAVYDTDGKQFGRNSNEGERQEHYGIQIKVRQDRVDETVQRKIDAIKVAVDETIYREDVTISSRTYLVQAFTRTSNVLQLGLEPVSRRRLYTINGTVSLWEI